MTVLEGVAGAQGGFAPLWEQASSWRGAPGARRSVLGRGKGARRWEGAARSAAGPGLRAGGWPRTSRAGAQPGVHPVSGKTGKPLPRAVGSMPELTELVRRKPGPEHRPLWAQVLRNRSLSSPGLLRTQDSGGPRPPRPGPASDRAPRPCLGQPAVRPAWRLGGSRQPPRAPPGGLV